MGFMCCLYRLKPGTDRSAWDRFVTDSDVPLTHRMPSVVGYHVHHIGNVVEGDSAFEYLELIEFSNRKAFEEDMAGDVWAAGVEAMNRNGLAEEVCFYLDEDLAGA